MYTEVLSKLKESLDVDEPRYLHDLQDLRSKFSQNCQSILLQFEELARSVSQQKIQELSSALSAFVKEAS